MAATLVRPWKSEVLGLKSATTSTFHHSGSPLLRVATTWLCSGIAALYSDVGSLTPSADARAERSMVGGWSMHVAVLTHWVGGGVLRPSGTGMYRVSAWVVLPRVVPSAEVPVGLADDGPWPASQPVVACDATAGSQ